MKSSLRRLISFTSLLVAIETVDVDVCSLVLVQLLLELSWLFDPSSSGRLRPFGTGLSTSALVEGIRARRMDDCFLIRTALHMQHLSSKCLSDTV